LVGFGFAGGVAVPAEAAISDVGGVDVCGIDGVCRVWVGEVDSAAGWWWRWGRIAGDA
jgi:hypothetical protein